MLEDAANELEVDLIAEIIQNFTSLNIQIKNGKLKEFLYTDNENNEEYSQAVLEDIDKVLKTMTIEEVTKDNDKESNDHNPNNLSAECDVNFLDFE